MAGSTPISLIHTELPYARAPVPARVKKVVRLAPVPRCAAAGSALATLGLLGVVWVAVVTGRQLVTALYTVRAMALAPALSRRLSNWVKTRDYSDDELFRADGAEARWAERRQKTLDRLAMHSQGEYAKSIAWDNDIRESFSDLRFTDANRLPFPFMRMMRKKIKKGLNENVLTFNDVDFVKLAEANGCLGFHTPTIKDLARCCDRPLPETGFAARPTCRPFLGFSLSLLPPNLSVCPGSSLDSTPSLASSRPHPGSSGPSKRISKSNILK